MRNKMISISEEMFEQLRECGNASALIESLLRTHFKINAPNSEKLAEKENVISDLAERLKFKQAEANKIIIEVHRKEEEIKQVKEDEEKAKEKREKQKIEDRKNLIALVESEKDLVEKLKKGDDKVEIRAEYVKRGKKMDVISLIKYLEIE
jgi:hypothetical protein